MAAQQSPKPNPTPTSEQIKRWRKYLAEERAEAHAYREIAKRREGKSRLILEELAAAERRHEEHWLRLLGPHAEPAPRTSLYARILQALAIRIGSVFILALMQRSEERGTYDLDGDATRQMAADEHLHSEVVRALAAKSRAQFSGKARAMVFGINDGLVSNLALIGGIVGAGSSHLLILLTGFSGLVAGALSMAAGEFISVTSQREILSSSLPDPNMTKPRRKRVATAVYGPGRGPRFRHRPRRGHDGTNRSDEPEGFARPACPNPARTDPGIHH